MQKNAFWAFSILMTLTADCFAQAFPDKKMDEEIMHFMKHEKAVGLIIGILEKGKTALYSYGETEKGNGQLPDEHTIFEIGSITKTFTSTLLAYAVNEGKMNLNDPINKYLPDSIPPIQYEGIPVTIETISNHTSGMPDFPANFHFPNEKDYHVGDPFKNYDDSDLFSFYRHYKLTRRPGETMEYSSLAMATLGVILERVYNLSYDCLVESKICHPLGMNDTRQFFPVDSTLHFAKGYRPDGMTALPWEYKAFAGAAALRSTASDLLKYAQGNMGIAPSGVKEMLMYTHKVTYSGKSGVVGLGWVIIKSNTHEWLFHDGGTGGFKSLIIIDPTTQASLVILSNKCISSMDDLGIKIMNWLDNRQ